MKRVALALSLLLSPVAAAEFVTFVIPPLERPTTDTTIRAFAKLRNEMAAAVHNITVDVQVLGGAYIGGESNAVWNCANRETPYQLRCTTPVVAPGEELTLQIYVGPAVEGRFEVRGYAWWLNGPRVESTGGSTQRLRIPREVLVTNANDAGEGSLRAALLQLNGGCAALPCDVVFTNGPHTIAVETPLPPVTYPDFLIEGNGSTIDGAKLFVGHGLDVRGYGFYGIRNLNIRNFPWDGLTVSRNTQDDGEIAGNTISGNGSRGITFDDGGHADLTGNVVRDNHRSGIFIAAGSSLAISENRIERNGASGIYAGPRANDIRIDQNRIADNAHYGVASDRAASHVTLTDNSIVGNGLLGIDRGLDGFDGYTFIENPTTKVPPPRLVSARYDAATDTTRIVGLHYESDRWETWRITIYRNDVPGPHGDVVLGHPTVESGNFTLAVPGNLSGAYITGNATLDLNLGWSGTYAWTSEFSDSLEVGR